MWALILFAFALYVSFKGWGIVIFIGIIVLAIMLTNSHNSARNDLMQKNREEIFKANSTNFRSTVSVENRTASDYAIYVDERNQKIMFVNLISKVQQIYWFDEIVECSILEDDAAIQTGGVGRAVAGGVIAGGVGAVVGASTRKTTPTVFSLSVRIITTNIQKSLYEIPLITQKTKKDTVSYREKFQYAQRVYATVTSVIAAAKRSQVRSR